MGPHFLFFLGMDFVHKGTKGASLWVQAGYCWNLAEAVPLLKKQYHLKPGKNDKVEETLKMLLGVPGPHRSRLRKTYETCRWESLDVSSSLAVEEPAKSVFSKSRGQFALSAGFPVFSESSLLTVGQVLDVS